MRSYLSLIPISAKVRKRQNRMTILCVIISVMLVTTIFGMSDMMIRRESEELHRKHGNWHIKLEDISPEIAEEISQRTDVTAVGWSEVFNSDAEQPYYIGEKKAALYGSDSIYLTKLSNALEEGSYPQNDHEVMLSSNAKLALDVQTGDSVTIQTPAGSIDFTVSGFGSDDRDYYQGQTYMAAVYMTRAAFTSILEQNGVTPDPVCYVQFQDASKVSEAVAEIMQQYGLPDGNVSENTAVMGIAGHSSNKAMINVYGIAAVLFILVLLAGVLMISGSMNSNVAQRMKFFGMMRCIGASREQIIRYVRLEALNWCKTAVPFGLLLGTGVSVSICAVLHYGIGGEWESIPVFAVSPIGLVSGAVVGIVTVLVAAQAPAKRAAKVSPMAAVSGNMEMASLTGHLARHSGLNGLSGVSGKAPLARHTVRVSASKGLSGISKKASLAGSSMGGSGLPVPFGILKKAPLEKRSRSLGVGKVETVLGIHHATASKKNWFLMTASFSLSIILFLSFSVGLDFLHELIPSLRSWQPDITLTGYANEPVINQSLSDTVRLVPGVEHVFGSSYMENVPAVSSGQEIDHVNLTSYSTYLLDCAKDSLVQGDLSEIYGDSGKVMTVQNKDNPLKVGDTIEIAGQKVEIVCAISAGLYPGEYSVICSQETFTRLTGEENYSMIGVQLGKNATDETVKQISSLAGSNLIFADMRESNWSDANTYLAAKFVMYSFLAVIAMITLFYMVNSISMSVTARMKQYGAMRAVGMDGKQLTRMIAAEAFTYAISGLFVGCGAGIAISRFLYIRLITRYFGTAWKLPVQMLAIIVVFDIGAAVIAVYAPAKRIRGMAVTAAINEL